MTDEVHWCSRIWYWPYFGFCPNERAWYAEMKNTQKWVETGGFAAIPEWPEPKEGMVSRLRMVEREEGKQPVDKLVLLVTVADHLDAMPIDTVVGIMAHEAVHIWQYLCEEIGEDHPSKEFMAYTLQTITQELLKGYLKTRRKGEFVTSEDKEEPKPPTGGDKEASDSSRTAHLDRTQQSPPATAGPIASRPRRRKAARRPPPAQ
jgi:hypothetical protein